MGGGPMFSSSGSSGSISGHDAASGSRAPLPRRGRPSTPSESTDAVSSAGTEPAVRKRTLGASERARIEQSLRAVTGASKAPETPSPEVTPPHRSSRAAASRQSRADRPGGVRARYWWLWRARWSSSRSRCSSSTGATGVPPHRASATRTRTFRATCSPDSRRRRRPPGSAAARRNPPCSSLRAGPRQGNCSLTVRSPGSRPRRAVRSSRQPHRGRRCPRPTTRRRWRCAVPGP